MAGPGGIGEPGAGFGGSWKGFEGSEGPWLPGNVLPKESRPAGSPGGGLAAVVLWVGVGAPGGAGGEGAEGTVLR